MHLTRWRYQEVTHDVDLTDELQVVKLAEYLTAGEDEPQPGACVWGMTEDGWTVGSKVTHDGVIVRA
jgi:hypothetical protein